MAEYPGGVLYDLRSCLWVRDGLDMLKETVAYRAGWIRREDSHSRKGTQREGAMMNPIEAYREGVASQRSGEPVDSNPYSNGCSATQEDEHNRVRWYSGWYDSHYAAKYGEPWVACLREAGIT